MLPRQEILRYRDMGPERRYALSLELAEWAWRLLDADGPETAKRRWELICRQREEAGRRLSEKFGRLP